MTAIEEITTDEQGNPFNASSFLNYMRKSSSHWWDNETQISSSWVFRGQWDARWKLVPTAARADYAGVPDFKRLVGDVEKHLGVHAPKWHSLTAIEKDKSLRCWAHLFSVSRFIELARELHFDVREIPKRTKEIFPWLESDGHKDFGMDAAHGIAEAFLGNYGPAEKFNFHTEPIIALAQHHGIATFVLDWTENPLAACYFASQMPRSESAPEGLAVWALNSHVLNQIASFRLTTQPCNVEVSRPAKSKNLYLAHQSGVVSYIPNPDRLWDQNDSYPDLEQVFQMCDRDHVQEMLENCENFDDEAAKRKYIETAMKSLPDLVFLRKIVLGESELPALRRLLLREGVSKAHMMPSLDNVASTAMASLSGEFL